ncbi:MAG: hypothetical protein HZB66_01430 [Candidatus Aenigmarchaeota archaeon]|nr:hypothetical protein [Candidatus Aenigmarchaeota archaeon]
MDVEEIENPDPSNVEDILHVAEEKSEKIKFWNELDKNIFKPGNTCIGCSPQIGLKLALQFFGDVILVCSEKCVPDMAKDITVIVAKDPLTAASVLSAEKPVLCYADDKTIKESLCSFNPKGNFLCICWNNSKPLWKTAFAKNLPYVATASIGYIEDYMSKLKKAKSVKGVRFIDLFAPCLLKKDFEPSDAVLLARIATNTGLWPVFEIYDNEFLLTQRPELEPVEHYYSVQKTGISGDKIEAIKKRVERNWSLLAKKKFWAVD